MLSGLLEETTRTRIETGFVSVMIKFENKKPREPQEEIPGSRGGAEVEEEE